MTSQPQVNTPDVADLEKQITMLGEQYGFGKDAQIKFALILAEGAFHGKFDRTPDKHGKGVDDAAKLFSLYMKSAASKVTFDTKPPSVRKGTSCARKCIELGGLTKFGGAIMTAVNDFVDERQTLRKKPENQGKLDDMMNAFLRWARVQVKADTILTASERQQFMFKRVPELPDAADILTSIRKSATALLQGKAANNTVLDDSSQVKAIIGACTSRLTEIANEKNKAKASNGVTVAKKVTAAVTSNDNSKPDEAPATA